jgi:hypothetical protein
MVHCGSDTPFGFAQGKLCPTVGGTAQFPARMVYFAPRFFPQHRMDAINSTEV